jgi:hypothetical protein
MRLTPNRPVETTEPRLVVDGLAAGAHRIRLVVVNERGERSKPTEVVIRVARAAPDAADPT